MKSPEIDEINKLYMWVLGVNQGLRANHSMVFNQYDTITISAGIQSLSKLIKEEYPFYANNLLRISSILFVGNGCSPYFYLNLCAFGELYIIANQLYSEPMNAFLFATIHPRICEVAQSLYLDKHYSSAAQNALKEVEARLREKFAELKPDVHIPSGVNDIIGSLFGKNGVFQFVDTSTTSGENYCRGVKLLFEGAFSAYRNPSAHANVECSKREAIEQIVLASQLMYILDLPNLPN